MSTLCLCNVNPKLNSAEQNINKELNKINSWLKVNKLSQENTNVWLLNKIIESLSLKIENDNIERLILIFMVDDKRKSSVEIRYQQLPINVQEQSACWIN